VVPLERAWVTSYGPSIVKFPLNHFRDIAAFSTPLLPTPPLVSPKFLHVTLGLGR